MRAAYSSIPGQEQLPQKKQKSGSQDGHADVEKDHSKVAEQRNQIIKYDLFHSVCRIDIKHVDDSEAAANVVDPGCNGAAGQIEKGGAFKILRVWRNRRLLLINIRKGGVSFQFISESSQDPDPDQKHMPRIRMKCQCGDRVMEPAGIRKDGYPSQQSEGHEEGQEGTAQKGAFRIRKNQQNIHGNTAELERKISPVIGAMIQKKGQTGLLPNLGKKHQHTADPEKGLNAVRKRRGHSEISDHNKTLLFS